MCQQHISLDPILRFLNLQLQRQERFIKVEENSFVFKTDYGPRGALNLKRWSCNSRS
jgi:hypothetical protein